MFSKFITKVSTFALAAGLSFDGSSDQELIKAFAEVASDSFPEVPIRDLDSDVRLCEYWDEY